MRGLVLFTCLALKADAAIRSTLRGANLKSEGAVHTHELSERQGDVRRPKTDRKTYSFTTFDSGLPVLAIQDPDAEKAAFAVAVEAGSLEDPASFQGLAHFCEHMVFLGSEKYPDQGDFSAQLALHGGNHNAYTSSDKTVYFNEIGNEGLDKAMDIFAQFFVAPSFKPEMVYKEIHAVDSEHKKNMPDTQRRLWHLLRSKANPANPMHQFSTGDLRTLKTQPESKGKSLVDALQKFHKENYCTNRLHLVLISNLTIDEQMSLAHKHFDVLPKLSTEQCSDRPVYTQHPAYGKQFGNLGVRYVMNTKGSPELWLLFPIVPLRKHYKQQAEAYLWNALGHYGPGSLKAKLLEEDFSQHYSFYAENSVAGSTVMMTFALTEKGAAHTDKVMELFFAYMSKLRKGGVDKSVLQSVKQLRQVTFDYQEKTSSAYDFVSTVAGSLPDHTVRDVLTGGHLIDEPDEALIQKILDDIVPANMNIAFVDPSFDESQAKEHEQYYGFGYDEAPIDTALIKRLEAVSDTDLAPPPALEFVPKNLDIIQEGAKEAPEQLLKDARTELWWLGMGEVKLPKAIISMKLSFPSEVIDRVEETMLAAMHSRLVNLVLEKPSDMLQTCGLGYSIDTQQEGLSLSFSGFDEHMEGMVKLVLPKVKQPDSTDDEFEMVRQQLLLDLGDITRNQPYQHALEALGLATQKGEFSRPEMLAALKDTKRVNPETHRRFLVSLFEKAQISLLFTGNIGRDRASSITKTIQSTLHISSKKLAESEKVAKLTVLKPKEEVEVRIANPTKDDPNSATVAAYQFGIPTLADRVHFSMLSEVINRPVFETLRTEHQLGYVVFGYTTIQAGVVQVRVLVQGFRKQPDEVETLIESTVQNITALIAAMPQKEFETRKQTLRSSLTKKDSTMTQSASRYWGQIWEQTYCFDKKQQMLNYIDSKEFSSPTLLLDAWKKVIEPSRQRKKVVVKLFGSKSTALVTSNTTKPGEKVVTLMDSVAIGKSMADEEYWPDEFLCH